MAPDTKPAAAAQATPRFTFETDVLIDTKGKGRYAPMPGVHQGIADECNANPDRFDHFVSFAGKPKA